MKTLYFDCAMGAAGDMLMAALLELYPDREGFLKKINGLGLPGVCVQAAPSVKCGVTGTHISVSVHGVEEESPDEGQPAGCGHAHAPEAAFGHEHGQAHHHTGLWEIQVLVSGLPVSERVKRDVLAVYRLIAAAESHVHGRSVDEVHFHEVGALDAVTDILGVCLLMEALAPDRVVCSPIHVGSGQVRCAHGILPVPAPATAHILQNVPVFTGTVRGELCTPTGAALLKHFASSFGPMPALSVRAIGYGMGMKNFEAANCVRAMLGETQADSRGEVWELRCNLDDMTPEAVGFALETLLENGALDAWTIPIGMKKSRPAVQLSCLCPSERADEFAGLLLRHTTTLGVRGGAVKRWTLAREQSTAHTKYGEIGVKLSSGNGLRRAKPEYDDVARAARAHGVTMAEVLRELDC